MKATAGLCSISPSPVDEWATVDRAGEDEGVRLTEGDDHIDTATTSHREGEDSTRQKEQRGWGGGAGGRGGGGRREDGDEDPLVEHSIIWKDSQMGGRHQLQRTLTRVGQRQQRKRDLHWGGVGYAAQRCEQPR